MSPGLGYDSPEEKLKFLRMRGQQLWREGPEARAMSYRVLGEFIFPWRCGALTENVMAPDVMRAAKIVNGEATLAYQTLVAGMLSGNSAPDSRWVKFTTDGADADDEEQRAFFEAVEVKFFDWCARTNAYRALGMCYGDGALYGTAAMLPHRHETRPFHCTVFDAGTYAIGQDANGDVCEFFSKYELTLAQAAQEFGVEKLPERLRDAANDPNRAYSTKVVCCQMIYKNPNYRPVASLAQFKRWSECWFVEGGSATNEAEIGAGAGGSSQDGFLREGGYDGDAFPVCVPRWSKGTRSCAYGVGLGIQAIADDVQLQGMDKDSANAVNLAVNPSMKGPAHLRDAAVKRRPGSYTAVDVQQGAEKVERLFDHDLNLSHVLELSNRIMERINRFFLVDWFRQLTASDELPKTAFLAARLVQEKGAMVLPVLQQQYDELLAPFCARVLTIMAESGELPTPPASLFDEHGRGREIKFEFISPLANAQRLAKNGGLETWLTQVAAFAAQGFPEMARVVDGEQVARELADGYSVPARCLRSRDEVAALMEAEAQAHEQAAAAEAAPGMAKAVKDLGTTPLGTDSALDAALPLAGVEA